MINTYAIYLGVTVSLAAPVPIEPTSAAREASHLIQQHGTVMSLAQHSHTICKMQKQKEYNCPFTRS